MNIKDKNINDCIRIMAAAAGLSLADVARAVSDSPQGLNQRLKQGKLQKDIDYLQKVAAACGFDLVLEFQEKTAGGCSGDL